MFPTRYFPTRYFGSRFFSTGGVALSAGYFAPRYFRTDYFGVVYFSAGTSAYAGDPGGYFAGKYFGRHYFAKRYFAHGDPTGGFDALGDISSVFLAEADNKIEMDAIGDMIADVVNFPTLPHEQIYVSGEILVIDPFTFGALEVIFDFIGDPHIEFPIEEGNLTVKFEPEVIAPLEEILGEADQTFSTIVEGSAIRTVEYVETDTDGGITIEGSLTADADLSINAVGEILASAIIEGIGQFPDDVFGEIVSALQLEGTVEVALDASGEVGAALVVEGLEEYTAGFDYDETGELVVTSLFEADATLAQRTQGTLLITTLLEGLLEQLTTGVSDLGNYVINLEDPRGGNLDPIILRVSTPAGSPISFSIKLHLPTIKIMLESRKLENTDV